MGISPLRRAASASRGERANPASAAGKEGQCSPEPCSRCRAWDARGCWSPGSHPSQGWVRILSSAKRHMHECCSKNFGGFGCCISLTFVGYLKNGILILFAIWLRFTLLSCLGAVWDSLQLEEKGGSLHMAGPFSISAAVLESDALSLSIP